MGIDILILVLLLVLGIPLPYCFVGAFLFMVASCNLNLLSLLVWGVSQMTSLTLIAGPVFILCGTILTAGKITDKILDVTNLLFNKIKGGLGLIVIVTCGFLGAISGSSFTGVAAVGPSLQPRMEKAGYPKGYAAALIASSTILGVLIPPSVAMIIYGWCTNTSVLACFLSTVVPAIILMFFMGTINILDAKKFCNDPGKAAADKPVCKADIRKKNFHQVVGAVPALFLPVLILGGIYGGIFTACEAACIATVFALLISFFIYRTMKLKDLGPALRKSGSSIGAIMTMIFFCLMLSQSYVMLDLPRSIVNFFMGITDSKIVVLLMINVFLIIIGMVVNDTTAIVLCAPILLPICQAYGISSVQLAAIMVVSLGFGGLTPPYASVLYLAMRVCNVKFEEIMKPTLKFLVYAYFPTVLLTTYISFLSTWLPKVCGLM